MKFVVIDDDPTGSQTVHDCLLLLKWDYSTLVRGFESDSNLFFILANTRSLEEKDAQLTIEEICKNLKVVIASEKYEEEIIFISRGDSTLRGHYTLLMKSLLIKQLLQEIKFLDMRQVMLKIFYFRRVNVK